MAVDVLQVVIPTISGLAGVGLGGWLTQCGQKIERLQRFVREQLSEFYAPMLGYTAHLKKTYLVREDLSRSIKRAENSLRTGSMVDAEGTEHTF